MKMRLIIAATIALASSKCFSQDTILTVDRDTILVKIEKISEKEIDYIKWSYIDGPKYSISTESVYKIVFVNGVTEIFNTKTVRKNEIMKDPELAIERGNNVFIKSTDATSKVGEEYLIQNLSGWGYWNVVDNKDLAHFVIVLTIEKRGMGIFKIWGTFETIDGQEFRTTESFKKSVSAFNGYNAARPLCEKLVEEYFKREFK